MKIKYFYRLFFCENPDDPECLKQTATLVDAEPIKKEWDLQNFTNEMARENALTRPYHTYLLSSLHSDFNENRFGACDHVLSEVERIERGEIDEYTYEGQGFMYIISREGVTFEHMIFGVCPEWPLWTCPLPHYKAVLKGFREFVKMPQSINSELIIELPEVEEKALQP